MKILANLPGYKISETLYHGTRTVVYRGIRARDKKPVVIKILRNENPNFHEVAQFRNQYIIAKNLNYPGIIKTLSLEVYQNGYALVMEDFGGVSLAHYVQAATEKILKSKLWDLLEFLKITIQITGIIHHLHQNRVIHKDIKPANILINPKTTEIKLIDFSISSLLPREIQEIENTNALEGTLAYLSPEQTGRMNRGIDYRSDFYSLGVTCYELLTGQLPFVSEDAMELVHFHLAKPPIPIHKLNPSIPVALSKIVLKMMAKNAEERYQSALGIRYDLETCLSQLEQIGQIQDFEIGQQDISDRFLIPEKLYGREAEVTQLLNAFERVSQGASEMMLVAGFSGIGKTAVINEVHKPIVRQRGYFIKGKYDQFNRNIPFGAFVQAFQDLIEQLLSESDTQLQTWKAKILEALGENGQVLIDVIPDLENIIGKQPSAPELVGTAAQNRFNLLFQKFVQVFTTKAHPLVIFLDDLQWADSASIDLLKILIQETEYLLVLGAYRDNEVSPIHPFILALNEIIKSGATLDTITLSALSKNDLNQLVSETLNSPLSLTESLTELIYQKTQGNPFFATQFLKALHEDKLITFNRHQSPLTSDRIQGGWQCDLAQVKALAITDDVVEFMALQLQKLPKETQDILTLAACIGAEFDLNTLVIVSEKSQGMTATALWQALQKGLVIPTTKIYKFFTEPEKEELFNVSANPTYRFLHDRVQQASYSLIPELQKKQTHYHIGKLLQQNLSEIEQEERLFDIVGHLNLGQELITQTGERESLARINLAAAQKARNSTAYSAAQNFVQIGLNLLELDRWKNQYKLCLDCYVNAAEIAYLNADFEGMEVLANQVLNSAKTVLDQVKIYKIKISARTTQNRMLEAIAIGQKALKLLGVEFSTEPNPALIEEALKTLADQLQDTPIEQLVNLPVMKDPQTIAAMELLALLFPPVYQASPGLQPLLCSTLVSLSLQFGNTQASTIGYAGYGMVLCAFLGEVEKGYRFGRLALSLLNRLNVRELKPMTLLWFGFFIQHRQEALRATFPHVKEGYLVGMEIGDFLTAGYNIAVYFYNNFFAGVTLEDLEAEIENYCVVLNKAKQNSPVLYLKMTQQMLQNLMGIAPQPELLMGTSYNESAMIAQYQKDNELSGLAYLYTYKLILDYLFYQPQNALTYITEANLALKAVFGSIQTPIFHFYAALNYLAVCHNQSAIEQANTLKIVESHKTIIEEWAQYAPQNYHHKLCLIEAEKYRILGQKSEAINLYDQAIAGAKQNLYLQEEALANELAAQFYLDWGKEKIAAGYIQEAYYGYVQWRAKAKVTDLEQRYPQLLSPILEPPPMTAFLPHTTTEEVIAGKHTSNRISEALDLATLLKASQAISSEIHLDKLLSVILEIIIANAGANKGVLLLKQDQNLQVSALIEFGKSPKILSSIPLESSLDVPITVVNTVKRTLKPLVLTDARINPRFMTDSYIQKYQLKSVLCSPLLHQGQLLGVLYLENHLTVGAFTRDRIELLSLICAQAAISLENACLYQTAQQALTELKEAQLQIVQSEKMSALGNLVSGIAHEINNPINFLSGNINPALDYIRNLFDLLGLIQEKYPHLDPEVQDKIATIELDYIQEDLPKLIESMQEGVKRINDISNSLRTFSRADTDRPVACNIHHGLDSTIMLLKHRLKSNENRPEIKVIKDYSDLPMIECYAGQLNQVFMNLLSNAIDALEDSNQGCEYSEINNQIVITTELSSDPHQVIIRIKDNGIGMSEDLQAKIFEHLFTTKAVGKGTGLGLAIARQIVVEKHSGLLDVKSQLGKGTEFTIILPFEAKSSL
ncbi:trifunctional serine/threonine-protein kinase/ATP-binding protein/sensor histidine kinase [Laspinema sp. A4]|uniref:trifunctional serine/threonine-protein kinase/ATP-binding protein/sensor histidine kinase n=1 Tax=Laspinema sp. D2d TaxID=2953686 RepID=UPI0021BB7A7A|nr:ATP-binding sensor histidine kinase [Laspinema sp. D2d]MCT7983686.1 trifunctional serine/threonine-protein kinase/ATP-binding protein/sensor histidine kinase [Laspinema sp. D2d]